MQSKISFVWSVCIISFVGALFAALIIFFPISASAPDGLVQDTNIIIPKKVLSQLPVQLKIPKIHVDAFIEYVGITATGAMDAPTGPNDVAWFDLGPRPGDVGNAIIAGHYGWKDNIPAAFDNLSKLKAGDIINTEDGVGSTTTFIVRKTQIYGESSSVSDVFDSTDGIAHLNLITCEGVWNDVTKSYSGRLVVFADEVNQK